MTETTLLAPRVASDPWSAAARELDLKPDGPVNIGWHASDRQVALGRGTHPALIWEDHQGRERRFDFAELARRSNTVAAFLERHGLGRGERLCLFLDRLPELYFAFLGALKLGAVVQPLFSAFGQDSLATRLEDAETAVVVTQRKHLGKVRAARERLPALRVVVVVDAGAATLREGEVALELDALPPVDDYLPAPTDAESPSLLHYTSGTTGQPKGVEHVHGSLPAQFLTAREVLDLRPDDVYWCNADPGWVTGTSYGIIGPWSNGVTQVVLDAGFNAERWYRFLEKHRVTVWYSAPTAIRLLMREGAELARRFDLSALRHLASVGEPLNPEAVIWSREAFGRPFHDTYWQTETGCIVIANRPGSTIKPGSMGRPLAGITAAVVDPSSYEPIAERGRVGLIALRPDWPARMRGYRGKPEAFAARFHNGWYLTGDRASIDADGDFWFVGRDDDVINTGGHLVGPFEIESALLEHPAVAESAAVAKPDPIMMEVVKAFVVLKPGFEPSADLELEIMNALRKRLSPLAMPQEIEFTASLPKTRSGKIVRRMLHAKEWNEPIGDLSTLMEE